MASLIARVPSTHVQMYSMHTCVYMVLVYTVLVYTVLVYMVLSKGTGSNGLRCGHVTYRRVHEYCLNVSMMNFVIRNTFSRC